MVLVSISLQKRLINWIVRSEFSVGVMNFKVVMLVRWER